MRNRKNKKMQNQLIRALAKQATPKMKILSLKKQNLKVLLSQIKTIKAMSVMPSLKKSQNRRVPSKKNLQTLI